MTEEHTAKNIMGSCSGGNHPQMAGSVIVKAFVAFLYLSCVTASPLVESAARVTTDVDGPVINPLPGSSPVHTVLPSVVEASKSPDFPLYSSSRQKNNRRKHKRHTGRRRDGLAISNAADLDTGVTIKVDPTNADLHSSGVIESTPEKFHSHSSIDSDEQKTIPLCPNCGIRDAGSETAVHRPLSLAEMTQVRIEAIKQQILDKLRLSEPPKVNVSNLHIPAPLSDGQIPDLNYRNEDRATDRGHHGDTIRGSSGQERYYGETTKIITQAIQGDTPCWAGTTGGKCFTFKFSSANNNKNIQSAELWVYWNGSVFTSPELASNLTVRLEEKPLRHSSLPMALGSTVLLNPSIAGWLTFDIKHNVRRWQKHGIDEHSIHIETPDFIIGQNEVTQALTPSTQGGYAPFIMIDTSKNRRRSRVKRSSDCTFVGSSSCCRESLYILFEDIGWDWIIFPRGFQANFCRGACHLSAHLESDNTSPMANVHHERNSELRKRGFEFETCCTPRSMSPLEVIHYKNGNFVRVVLPEMTINSCGCTF